MSEPGELLTEFNYYLPPPSRPAAPSANDVELILGTKDQETRVLPVYNVRTNGDIDLRMSLDTAGFTYVCQDWNKISGDMSDEEIESSGYYSQLEEMVKQLL